MALILKRIYSGYSWLFNEAADARTNEYFLMSSLIYPSLLLIGYLYFVKKLGPDLMKDRKPFDVKKILIVYNAIQIIVNFYLFLVILMEIPTTTWQCILVDNSYSQRGLLHIHITHLYFIIKVVDLLDTVFFVLRKSDRQITFLHLYHHCGILLGSWMVARFVPGGHVLWCGLSNTLVHTAMYSYYLLTVIDKNMGKNITFKKVLTQMQLIQFVWNILAFGKLILDSECTYPKVVAYIIIPQHILLIFMFGDFYIKNYIKNKGNVRYSKQK